MTLYTEFFEQFSNQIKHHFIDQNNELDSSQVSVLSSTILFTSAY